MNIFSLIFKTLSFWVWLFVSNLDQIFELIAIEQWMFFNLSHLLHLTRNIRLHAYGHSEDP